MDVRWLQDFLALAELRNFTRAAEYQNLSQAAFSRRIQSLEHWVGTALVVKGSQPVRLTEAGEQFREGAQVSVERLIEARAAIRGNQFEVMSQVRLAMPTVLARSDFRRLLGVIGMGKNTSFSVIVGTTAEVTARYLAGDADLLLAVGSTLQVFPVANMVPLAKQAGARVVIVNDAPTAMDELADAVLNGPISDILPVICGG